MRRFRIAGAAVLLAALVVPFTGPAAQAQTQDSWTTSLHDNSRDGASSDTVVSASQAPALTRLWSYSTGGTIASQPAIVNGVAYVGSWRSEERRVGKEWRARGAADPG